MLVKQQNCDKHEQTLYFNWSFTEYETKELLKVQPP